MIKWRENIRGCSSISPSAVIFYRHRCHVCFTLKSCRIQPLSSRLNIHFLSSVVLGLFRTLGCLVAGIWQTGKRGVQRREGGWWAGILTFLLGLAVLGITADLPVGTPLFSRLIWLGVLIFAINLISLLALDGARWLDTKVFGEWTVANLRLEQGI